MKIADQRYQDCAMERVLLLDNLSLTHKYDNAEIEDFRLEDMAGQKKLLSDLLRDDKYKLVFYFSHLHCESCIQSVVRSLETLKISPNNMVLIGEYANKRALKVLADEHILKAPVYYYHKETDKKFVLEEENVPFLCLMKRDLYIRHLLIPIKEIPNQMKRYMDAISERYFSE